MCGLKHFLNVINFSKVNYLVVKLCGHHNYNLCSKPTGLKDKLKSF